MMKNTDGISLIILVITIVILIILAGISIAQITGNGLFEKAKQAKQNTIDAQNIENNIMNDYIDKIDQIVENTGSGNDSNDNANISGTTIEFWGGKINAPFKGEGSDINPYKITNTSELAFLSMMVNFGESFEGKYFELSNDINLNENKYTINSETGEITFSSDAKQWVPIGNTSYPFKGTFDGKKHTIKGIYISNTLTEQALFGTNEGTIRNTKIEEGYIYASTYTGGICGENKNNGIIERCYSNITITASTSYVGGICGLNSGIIQECYNDSNVTTSVVYSGGICGYNNNIIKYCYNLGTIVAGKNNSSNSYAGGIVGYNYTPAEIQYTYNMGQIHILQL